MLDRAFKPLLNTKVVNDENENNWAPSMVPKTRSCGLFVLSGFVAAFAEKIIRQFSRLWQAVSSLKNFEIYPSSTGV